jgi:hypothetical protein
MSQDEARKICWLRLQADRLLGCNQHFLGGVTGRDITSVIEDQREDMFASFRGKMQIDLILSGTPDPADVVSVYGAREYLVTMPNRLDARWAALQNAIPITRDDATQRQRQERKDELRQEQGTKVDIINRDGWVSTSEGRSSSALAGTDQ